MLSIFLLSLAGVPPLAGWFAKFVMFRAVFDAGTTAAVVLGVIAAINSVVAFFYYVVIPRKMWFHEPAEGAVDAKTKPTPVALNVALLLTTATVLVIGVYPQFFARLGELAFTPG
jgi:NADH-quinone oxidoreductase subunit N